MIHIQLATENDLEWINEQYKEADFVLSDLENEFVIIALLNDERAGVGRLVKLDHESVELGGIYTLEEFRGQDIAATIVQFLVDKAQELEYRYVYCLPFETLREFYTKYGFEVVKNKLEDIHPTIVKKYEYCVEHYDKKVLLMKLI